MYKPKPKTSLTLPTAHHLLRTLLGSLKLVFFLVAFLGLYIYTRGYTPTRVEAATSSTLNFQARIYNSSGSVVPDGNYHIEFKLHDHTTNTGGAQGTCSGSCVWRETRTTGNLVTVRNGYFSVNLGSVTALPTTINWDQDLYLSMNIGTTTGPTWDGEMTPRIKLTAVPYAFRAGGITRNDGTNNANLSFASSITNNPNIILPNITGTNNALLQSGTTLFTQGSIPFTDSTGRLTQDNANFFFDDTNNRLGINDNTPLYPLTVGAGDLFGVQSDGSLIWEGSVANAFETILRVQNPTADLTFELPNAAAGTYEVCTSANNCTALGAYINNTTTVQADANIAISSAGTSSTSLLIQARASQTADLLRFRASNGTSVIGGFTPSGVLYFNDQDGTGVSRIQVQTGSLSGTHDLYLPNAGGEICTTAGNCVGNGGAGDVFKNGQDGPLVIGTNDNTSFLLETNNTNRIEITGSGNVGIGTSSTPAQLLSIGGTTGNLTVNSSGNLVTAGDLTVNGSAIQLGNNPADALTVFANATFNTDVDFTLAETENVNITNTVTGTNNLDLISATLTNNTTSGTQRIAVFQNAVGTGDTEQLLYLNNADTDTAVTTGLLIQSAAGGITTGIDISDSDIVTGINLGANDIIGTTAVIDFDNFDVDASGNVTLLGDLTAGVLEVDNTAGEIGIGGFSAGTRLNIVAEAGGSQTALRVDNADSTGAIAIFSDNGTPVLTIADGGDITATGTLILDGAATITTGTDQDLTLQGNGAGEIILDDLVQVTTLGTSGTAPVCINTSNQLSSCDSTVFGVTLQNAYDASANPEIIVDSTRGAVTIRDNATPLAANLLEVQSNDGLTDYFAVTAAGLLTSGNISLTGATGVISATTTDAPLTVQSNGTGALTLDSTGTGAINIGTSALAKTITVGNSTGATQITLDAGTGGIQIGANGIANTIQIGNTSGAVTQTVNIGTNATAGSTNNVNIGSSVAGTVTLYSATSVDLNSPVLQFTEVAGTRSIGIQTRTTNTAGTNLTISAGTAGSGSGAFTGGTLTLQGGDAGGTGDANGANIVLTGGNGVGTGVQGLVTVGSASFTASLTQSFPNTGGTIAQSAVDNFSTIPVTVASGGPAATVTLPAPTQNIIGRILYITVLSGSKTFNVAPTGGVNFSLSANASATFMWNGSGWTNAGVDSGSASFILNQSSTAQTTANFWISGTGRADTAFLSPLFSTPDITSGSSNSADVMLRSGNVSTASGNTTGNVTIKSGDGSGGNNSSGNVIVDSGAKTGSGTNGTISIGTTNASALTIGNNTANLIINSTGFDLAGDGAVTASGGYTFSGVTTDITTGIDEDLTIVANGAGQIILNDIVQVTNLVSGSNGDTLLCRNDSDQLTDCGATSLDDYVTLQNAYDNINGNTITTTDGRDITFILADTATDANFLVDIATGSTGRFAVQGNGTDVLSVTGSDVVIDQALTVNAAASFTSGITLGRTIPADSGTTTNVADINFTTPADTAGTNVSQGLNITPTIGNATGGTNTANIINIVDVTGDDLVTLNAIKIGNLTGTAATEYAFNVGTGWDSVLRVGGTEVINGDGEVITTQLSGTLFSIDSDSASPSTIAQGATVSLLGGNNGIDVTHSGDTATFDLDTTEIGTTTFGAGSGFTWTLDAGSGTDPEIVFGDDAIDVTVADFSLSGDLAVNGGDITSTGALTVTPGAGTNFNIVLSTTGDFAVNISQLVVDTSESRVGIGTAAPGATLHVVTDGASEETLVINNGTSTGNIFVAQDNGTPVLTIADGGDITATGSLIFSGAVTDITTVTGESLTLTAAGAGIIDLDDIVRVGMLGATDTADLLCRNAAGQLAGCATTGNGAAYVQGGNDFGAVAGTLGLTSNEDLNIITGGQTRFIVQADGDIAFDAADNTFFIDAQNNRVGVGTSSPGQALSVVGNQTLTGSLTIDALTGSSNATINLTGRNAGVGANASIFANQMGGISLLPAVGNPRVGIGLNPTAGASLQVGGNVAIGYPVNTATTASDGLIVSGNVGIGVTNPTSNLQIYGLNSFSGTSVVSSATNLGNLTVFTNDAQGADVGAMIALGGSRGATTGVFGGIRGAKENNTVDQNSGYLGFYTLQSGVAFAERMRISSTGDVGIGTTTPTTRLDIVGLDLSANPTNTAGVQNNSFSVTKNDTNTRTFTGYNLQATLNTGGSNANTTLNVLNVDTVNTATTGLSTNLLRLAYGGSERLTVSSAGTLTISSTVTDITTLTGEDLTLVAAGAGTIVLNDTVTVADTLTLGATVTDITTLTGENLTIEAGGAGIIDLNDLVRIGTLGTADTAAYVCRNAAGQLAECNTTGNGVAFVQGGNNFGAVAGTLGLTSNQNLDIITNNLTRLTVEAGGNLAVDTNTLYVDATNNTVGIGTVRAGAIDGTANSRLLVYGSGTTSATSALNVTNSSLSSLLFVRDDGNIGIGTATPTTKLQVAGGTIAATGASSAAVSFRANNSIGTSAHEYGFVNNNDHTANTAMSMQSFTSAVTVSGGTVTDLYGFVGGNASGAGTVTRQYGMLIDALTKGASNAGIVIGEATGTNQANLVIGQTTIPTGTYSIYNSSPDQNYFAGRLGIGTGATTPAARLHVSGSGIGADIARIRVSSTDDQAGIELLSDNSGPVVLYSPDGTDDFRIYTGTDNRFTILSGGNVGIGTTSPGSRLHVISDSATDLLALGGVFRNTTIAGAQTTGTFLGLGTYIGLDASATFSSSTGSIGSLQAIQARAINSNTSLVTSSCGICAGSVNSSTGTITNAFGAYIQNVNATTGTITNAVGIYVTQPVTAIGGTTPAVNVTNKYAIITEPGAGNVGFGVTTPNAAKLQVLTDNPNGIQLTTGGATTPTSIGLGRTAIDGLLGIAGANDNYSDEATQGDIILRASTADLILSARNGTGAIRFTTGSTDTAKLTITNAGDVGVSDATPDGKFHIQGTSDDQQFIVQGHSAQTNNIFEIKNHASLGGTVLAAVTGDGILKIGTVAAPTLGSAKLLVTNAEIQDILRVGNGTDRIETDATTQQLRFFGSAQNSKSIMLAPEFAGAVLTPDGSNNVGTMTSDFCSNSSPAVNTGICGAANERHNYYAWTGNATNDYDIWLKWQVPSDFSGFDTTPIQFYGWRTSSTSGTHVRLSLVDGATGAVCGTMTPITNTTTWSITTYNSSGCTPTHNQIMYFRVELSVGVNGEFARMGEIFINYKADF